MFGMFLLCSVKTFWTVQWQRRCRGKVQMALPVETCIGVSFLYPHLFLKADPPWLQMGTRVCTVTMAMHAYSVLLPFYDFGTWLNILPSNLPAMKSPPWHQMDLSRQAPIPSLKESALQMVKVVFPLCFAIPYPVLSAQKLRKLL